MEKLKGKVLLGVGLAALLAAGGGAAWAAGIFGDLPGVGYPSYCASYSSGANGSPQCASSVPAGPTTFAGTEYSQFDIGPLGGTNQGNPPQSVDVGLLQLGQGSAVDNTAPATTQTIGAGVSYYFLDGAQASAFTVTMPAAPLEGQFVHIVCEAATVGALTVAANTGQTVKYTPGAACVAGTAYNYRYSAANSTWYKV